MLPRWAHKRVIHSIYPPTNLFDYAQSDADAQLLAELEGETSDRLVRWRESVDLSDARFGYGWGPVMASFCYIAPGRFNTANFGCYYAANTIGTAIAEWSHHAGKVWRDFGYQAIAHATVRSYLGHIEQPLVDVRSDIVLHDLADYSASQSFARELKQQGSYGILYRSVRANGGECVALLRPPATGPVKQGSHFSVNWDGNRFTGYQRLGKFQPL